MTCSGSLRNRVLGPSGRPDLTPVPAASLTSLPQATGHVMPQPGRVGKTNRAAGDLTGARR